MAIPFPGTIVQLKELFHPASPFREHNKSLRVMGRLEHCDDDGIAHIVHDGAKLMVDTTCLQEGVHLAQGSLYQFIGELLLPLDSRDQMVLRARVGRNVNSLDVKLYDSSLQLRRQFEQAILNR